MANSPIEDLFHLTLTLLAPHPAKSGVSIPSNLQQSIIIDLTRSLPGCLVYTADS